ncbi:hypothetical protein J23TS9_03700 [Paenibacillus sp. J23TS9]|uniref:Uncharacterized protein n=1 Tax=Paenibacillus dokdonensis TaxID=2567944 RepID=A0ABU6GWV2_9BACL|nr:MULTISPECIES: hypothetical protein [Paenibacillus]MEC0243582.1 hypothetical protein [Paenibacillus dokdonensis]GIP25240.1 hypothetical protein J23TS9_03700 [Paenibacillus sp. J23TS9]
MPESRTHSPETAARIKQITDPRHILCREDMLWVLHYVQQKVAQGEPALLELSKPRILQNFQYFGDAALLLLSRITSGQAQDEQIRACLQEAMHGLIPPDDEDEP